MPDEPFRPNYVRPELLGGLNTPAIAALLQMTDPIGLSPGQLDRNAAMRPGLFGLASAMSGGQTAVPNLPDPASMRRWNAEDLNSVMIKYNNWRKQNFGQELTPQERVTQGFIDVRNPNSRF